MIRKLYAGDCLDILNDELAISPASVDLIYLDPPFNSNSKYNLPFKGKYKNATPVIAFEDTWSWGEKQDESYKKLKCSGTQGQLLANFIDNVRTIQKLENRKEKENNLSAYLVNMVERLIKMRTVLKNTGSIYLHCDPTASHYLKIMMDIIFGSKNFRNELVWYYRGAGTPRSDFARRHDIIFRYGKSRKETFFNPNPARQPYAETTRARFKHYIGNVRGDRDYGVQELHPEGKHPDDVITDIQPVAPSAKERLGYPTQKPLALLERIVETGSKEGDVILDPFCGCGTAVEAAEKLNRQWIGIDISTFSTGLIRERVVRNIQGLDQSMVEMYGVPTSIEEAKSLAKRDKFEFEKWVCGAIGAYGLYHPPGTRGADGGVDGILDFYPMYFDKKVKKERAIIQVKGGHVSPDNVKALYQTVLDTSSCAGVLVCFESQMRTVENNRKKDIFEDHFGKYPIIQGFTVEQLINNERLQLPQYQKREESQSVRLI